MRFLRLLRDLLGFVVLLTMLAGTLLVIAGGRVGRFFRDETGAETVELAILAAVIVAGLGAIIYVVATAVRQHFRRLGGALDW